MLAPLLPDKRTDGWEHERYRMTILLFFALLYALCTSFASLTSEKSIGGIMSPADKFLDLKTAQSQTEAYFAPENDAFTLDTKRFFDCIYDLLPKNTHSPLSLLTQKFIEEPNFLAKKSEVLNSLYLECYNQREIRRQTDGREEKFDFVSRFEHLAKQYGEVLVSKFPHQMIQNCPIELPNIFDQFADWLRIRLTIIHLTSWFHIYADEPKYPGYRVSMRFNEDVKLSSIYEAVFKILAQPSITFIVLIKLAWPGNCRSQEDVIFGVFDSENPIPEEAVMAGLQELERVIKLHTQGLLSSTNLLPMQYHLSEHLVLADYSGGESFGETLAGAITEFFFYRPALDYFFHSEFLKHDPCFRSMPRDLDMFTNKTERLDALVKMYSSKDVFDSCHRHFVTSWIMCKHVTPMFFPKEFPREKIFEFNIRCLTEYVEEMKGNESDEQNPQKKQKMSSGAAGSSDNADGPSQPDSRIY